ncbi:MAG TPA: hypothetical protein VJB89_00020 [Candidatus Nanoarchaeia archaeon]|nr:hypothetical protein [Candidatus Nanoarchaeia archaeon]
MPKKKIKKRVVKKTIQEIKQVKSKRLTWAIVGLVINAAFLPGLGSLIIGKTKTGLLQLLLVILGVVLCLTIVGIVIGIPLLVGTWVWGIVTCVKVIQNII